MLNLQQRGSIITMTTNYQEISGDAFGKRLKGFGINILVTDVPRTCKFLKDVLEFEILRTSQDFAILRQGSQLFQLHADHTYSENPLPSLLPENGARGGGAEFRLYDIDPDKAEARARAGDYMILQQCKDKPHGLRECFILDPDGYCWCPSRPKDYN